MPLRRSTSFRTISLLMLLPVGGLVIFFAVRFVRQQFANGKQSTPQHVEEASVVAPRRPAPRKSVIAKAHRGGSIVVILDDVGFDHQPLAGAMRIDPNVNFAVLPNGARSQEFARELNAKGFELLCHLPMEPENPRQSPGANAVMTTMTDAQIEATTRANVEAIPHARGVNNHMGSRATSDRRVMTRVLSALPKGLYFIDSRTAGTSLAADVARELNIRTASRSVFLDDVQKEDAIRVQLAALVSAAELHGMAIGIGHMYPETVRVLAAEAPALRSRGFRFLRASEVVN
jgi:polysaccharide deacetylase 2 family uncharacterized protein YibQ